MLSTLPIDAYCIRHYLRGKSTENGGHVFMSADKHYYSVPHRFIGQEVKLEYTEQVVEVFHHRQRIATHQRDRRPGKYTNGQRAFGHQHPPLLRILEYAEFFAKRAATIGPEVEELHHQTHRTVRPIRRLATNKRRASYH